MKNFSVKLILLIGILITTSVSCFSINNSLKNAPPLVSIDNAISIPQTDACYVIQSLEINNNQNFDCLKIYEFESAKEQLFLCNQAETNKYITCPNSNISFNLLYFDNNIKQNKFSFKLLNNKLVLFYNQLKFSILNQNWLLHNKLLLLKKPIYF
jgi:hypothetical protein